MSEICCVMDIGPMVERLETIIIKEQSNISKGVELQSFPYFLFDNEWNKFVTNCGATHELLTKQETKMIRVKHSFVMNRKEFVQKLRPLLNFCSFDEFTETYYDDPASILMKKNLWIKRVLSSSGKEFYSLKSTAMNHESSNILSYTEINLDIQEMETKVMGGHEVFELFHMCQSLDYLLTKYLIQFKVHRTQFEFKSSPHIKLNVDRVSFIDQENGYIVYSLFCDIPIQSINLINIMSNSVNNTIPNLFELCKDDLKPARNKIIQYMFERKRDSVYNELEQLKLIPKIDDYQTISLFQYEAKRIKLIWEEYNNKVVSETMKKSQEYIDYMENAALQGKASITYEDDEGNSHPYYSDDEL